MSNHKPAGYPRWDSARGWVAACACGEEIVAASVQDAWIARGDHIRGARCSFKDCKNDAGEAIAQTLVDGTKFHFRVCDPHALILRRGSLAGLSVAKNRVVEIEWKPARRAYEGDVLSRPES